MILSSNINYKTLILQQEIDIKTEYNIKEHEHVHIKRSLTLKNLKIEQKRMRHTHLAIGVGGEESRWW